MHFRILNWLCFDGSHSDLMVRDFIGKEQPFENEIVRNANWIANSDQRHISLRVPYIKFNFNVFVRHCLQSTHTSKLNLTLGTHLHAVIRTHHFDFDIRFWPISTLMSKTLHQSRILRLVLSVICVHTVTGCRHNFLNTDCQNNFATSLAVTRF